ncbi:MAG: bifunctional riboflavin kinase/FAD synthetase [Nocardioidaceae bacterium]|nr:bifunctional riboflavin kinase/FAD synthetase [Marmoricola sp.]
MALWTSFDALPDDLGPTVATIGNFDGVHLGHQHVIATAVEAAHAELPVVAVTFEPHPMAVLRPEHAPARLTSLAQRAILLEQSGADHVLAIPFSREIASWTPEEFITRVLIDALHVQTVVVGANFRFGAKAAGDVQTLRGVGQRQGFEVIAIDLDGGPQVWSSTYIRSCLAAGDVEGAAEALGRNYSVAGVVSRGDQRGRELGFPTANVPIGEVIAPADGVYAGWLLVDGERLPAAISVGTNPTFAGQRARRVEAYALDRDDLDLYDREVSVEFVAQLRGMVAFDDVHALVKQMDHDVALTRATLDI